MSTPQNLKDLYLEELQDLWSANDQMVRVVREMADVVVDETLKSRLQRTVGGIEMHTVTLKDLIGDVGGELKKEHCKGMEGLVREALHHAVEMKAPDEVRDVAAIAQFQRMSHYGLAGFGTAAAYAEALGYKDAAIKLNRATSEIYSSDEYMTYLAERSQNLEAKGAVA